MPKLKLTKRQIDKIQPPSEGQDLYYDITLPGFGLRVGRRSRTYFAERRVGRRTRRVTIGRHGHYTCEQARQRDQVVLSEMADGRDPTQEKRAERARGATMAEAFDEFIDRRSLRPQTVYNYSRFLEVAFGDWREKPLTEISSDLVVDRHTKLSKERGGPYADHAMRFLRSLWNFAAARYEDPDGNSLLPRNPTSRLSRLRMWHKPVRRQTYVRPDQMAAWYRAVDDLADDARGETARDYLLLVLLTGLRRSEAARLRWDDVDLDGLTLTVRETKNGEPLTVPLSKQLLDLLSLRSMMATCEYVFPGTGATGHLTDVKRSVRKVCEASGVRFTLHDLRRTFITAAEGLDVSAYALKRLVNHSMAGDVTAGYIVHDVERLREPMQRISDCLLASYAPRLGGPR